MAFLFGVNIIVVSMVVREVCGTTTKETPAEVMENSGELEVIKLTSEEERATLDKNSDWPEGSSTEVVIREPSRQEEEQALTNGQLVDRKEDTAKHSEPFYALRAATLSMWLPAVVGNKKNLFLAASISTLVTKIVMLVVSVILVYHFPEKVHSSPFLLWSRVGKSLSHQDSTGFVAHFLNIAVVKTNLRI